MHPRKPEKKSIARVPAPRNRPRRKMSDDDRLWTPRSSNKRNRTGGDPYPMRADKSKTVKIGDVNVRYSAATLIEKNRIQTTNAPKLEHCIEELTLAESKTPTHRKIQKVTFDENNSPIQIETPNGTVLPRRLTTGLFHFFDNRAEGKSPVSKKNLLTEIDDSHDFFKSDGYKKIKRLHSEEKTQDVVVTTRKLQDLKKVHTRNGNRRIQTQNQVQAVSGKDKDGSATQYAAPLAIAPNANKEHTHLAAHKATGASGQVTENMSVATEHANTAMMLPEGAIDQLAATNDNGLRLMPSAKHVKVVDKENQVQEYLQMATVIDYKMKTAEDEFALEFNAQTDIAPHIAYRDATRSFFNIMSNKPNAKKVPVTFFDRQQEPSNPTHAGEPTLKPTFNK